MRQYKIRQIVSSKSQNRPQNTKGITIPDEYAVFFEGVHFKINRMTVGSRNGLFLESGCPINPSKKEIEVYEFGDCRV